LLTTDFTPLALFANSSHLALQALSLHSPLMVATPSVTLTVMAPVISGFVFNFSSTAAFMSESFGVHPIKNRVDISNIENKIFEIFIFNFCRV